MSFGMQKVSSSGKWILREKGKINGVIFLCSSRPMAAKKGKKFAKNLHMKHDYGAIMQNCS
jgi:hypothetical protein